MKFKILPFRSIVVAASGNWLKLVRVSLGLGSIFHWSMIEEEPYTVCSHPKKNSCPGNRNPDSEVAAVQYEDKHWKCYRNFGHCQLDQDAAQHQATVWKLKKNWCHESVSNWGFHDTSLLLLLPVYRMNMNMLWLDLITPSSKPAMMFFSLLSPFMVCWWVTNCQVGHRMCQQPLESAESAFGSVQLPVLLAPFEC